MAEYDEMTGDEFQVHLFIESANAHMRKLATEVLGKENQTMQQLKVMVIETKNALWYNQKKDYGKMANVRKGNKFCKPCNNKMHSEADCWGPCGHCGRRNHQTAYCKFKESSSPNQTAERASKGTEKSKKKNKKTSKKATIENSDSRRESEEESEEGVSKETLQRRYLSTKDPAE